MQVDPALTSSRIIIMKNNNPSLSPESLAVIKVLREYLTRAEAGKVHGLCLTTANDDHTYDYELAGSYEAYPTDAIGPLNVLTLKLTRKALGVDN